MVAYSRHKIKWRDLVQGAASNPCSSQASKQFKGIMSRREIDLRPHGP